jgi:hypothetical protein
MSILINIVPFIIIGIILYFVYSKKNTEKTSVENKNVFERNEKFDEVVNEILIKDGEKNLNNQIQGLIYAVNMHYQVLNGGVVQFVDNSTGDFFEETLVSLKKMKMEKYVEILERIKQIFPNQSIPKNMEERRNIIDGLTKTQEEEWKMEELWEEFDEIYYRNEKLFENKVVEYYSEI